MLKTLISIHSAEPKLSALQALLEAESSSLHRTSKISNSIYILIYVFFKVGEYTALRASELTDEDTAKLRNSAQRLIHRNFL